MSPLEHINFFFAAKEQKIMPLSFEKGGDEDPFGEDFDDIPNRADSTDGGHSDQGSNLPQEMSAPNLRKDGSDNLDDLSITSGASDDLTSDQSATLPEKQPEILVPILYEIAKTFAEIFEKEPSKILDVLQGQAEVFENSKLGKGQVNLLNVQDAVIIETPQKIAAALNEGKIVLGVLSVTEGKEDEYKLSLELATNSGNMMRDIEQMKRMIAMNIQYAQAHKDLKIGFGAFNIVWKKMPTTE